MFKKQQHDIHKQYEISWLTLDDLYNDPDIFDNLRKALKKIKTPGPDSKPRVPEPEEESRVIVADPDPLESDPYLKIILLYNYINNKPRP
jgi:hypothetical protein